MNSIMSNNTQERKPHTKADLRLALAACCLMLHLPVHSVHADVSLKLLEVGNLDWVGGGGAGYGAFDPAEVPQTLRFKVKLEEGESSSYFVTVSAGVSGDYQNRQVRQGNEALTYQLYDSEGGQRTVLKALPTAAFNEVLSGSLSAEGDIQELACVAIVVPAQVRRSGLYTDTFTLTLYSGTLQDYTEQDAKTVVLSVPAGENVELSLSPSGSSFDSGTRSALMDFGALRKDAHRELDLRVRSNAGYSITLESDNNGVLKHTGANVNSVVPYTLRLAGNPVNLGSGAQTPVLQPGRLTDANGDNYELSVTIGEVSGAVAGDYRGVITGTVAAQN